MIEIDIKGLDETIKKFNHAPETIEKHLRAAMSASVIEVEREAKKTAPIGVSGRLRNSIASEVTGVGADIVGKVGSTLRSEVYPVVMEYGRKPGSAMPPPSALERWVHIKLGLSGNEARGVAFVIARSIARKGIKPRMFLHNAYKHNEPKIIRYFVTALKRIAGDL